MLRRYDVAVLALIVSILIAAGCNDPVAPGGLTSSAAPRFSNGQKTGQCWGVAATQVEPDADGGAVVSAQSGEVVTGVAIKAGPECFFTPTGSAGTFTIVVEGAPCYVVLGLQTPTATVTRVRSDSECKDISHVEFTSGVVLPPDPGEDG